MSTPSVNGVNVPATMANRGKFTFFRQPTILSASGKDFAGGPQRCEWVFPYLEQSDWNWWVSLLSGQLSYTVGTCELWDDSMNAVTFTSGELHRIKCRGGHFLGLYHDVLVMIDWLMPIQA